MLHIKKVYQIVYSSLKNFIHFRVMNLAGLSTFSHSQHTFTDRFSDCKLISEPNCAQSDQPSVGLISTHASLKIYNERSQSCNICELYASTGGSSCYCIYCESEICANDTTSCAVIIYRNDDLLRKLFCITTQHKPSFISRKGAGMVIKNFDLYAY